MVFKLLEYHKAQSLQPPYVSFIRSNYSKFAYKILEWNDTFCYIKPIQWGMVISNRKGEFKISLLPG